MTAPAAERAFLPELASVRAAREFVRHHLVHVDDDLRETAVLLVSELATNSVSHAATPFNVTIDGAGPVVRIAVGDHDPTAPTPGAAAIRDLSGRGLAIVARLALDWGIEPVDGGKVVWFTLPPRPSS